MTRFLHGQDVWMRITELANGAAKGMAAVAYFGKGAHQLLPLKSGSVIVVDCHPNSVKSGRTCPHDLLVLIKQKVEVHSCSNLHAKVFVFGKRAVIGSSNASRMSRDHLVEAAVETTDSAVVADCREFVQSLRGEQITPKYAAQLAKLWNPPKFKPVGRSSVPSFRPLWVVPLTPRDWSDRDAAMDKKAEPLARKKLSNRKRFVLDKFQWHGSDPFGEEVKAGHQVIQAVTSGEGHRLYVPSRVIHVKRYLEHDKPQMIVYLESPRVRPTWRSEETIRAALGNLEEKLKLKHAARRVRNSRMAHILLQQWPGNYSE